MLLHTGTLACEPQVDPDADVCIKPPYPQLVCLLRCVDTPHMAVRIQMWLKGVCNWGTSSAGQVAVQVLVPAMMPHFTQASMPRTNTSQPTFSRVAGKAAAPNQLLSAAIGHTRSCFSLLAWSAGKFMFHNPRSSPPHTTWRNTLPLHTALSMGSWAVCVQQQSCCLMRHGCAFLTGLSVTVNLQTTSQHRCHAHPVLPTLCNKPTWMHLRVVNRFSTGPSSTAAAHTLHLLTPSTDYGHLLFLTYVFLATSFATVQFERLNATLTRDKHCSVWSGDL